MNHGPQASWILLSGSHRFQRVPKTCTLKSWKLKGRLTIETVASFQDAIRKEHAQELIVDMSGVPSMDSAGLGIMIAPYVHAKKTSRQVGFAGMNERVKAVTETSRLSQFLQIFATVKDAEAALSNSW